MTEHSAVVFVFFFLAEYASIVLICVLTSLLFLGGYLIDFSFVYSLIQYYDYDYYIENIHKVNLLTDFLSEGLISGLSLGIKTCILIFVYI
jgi:NADH-ubiquinone oxidoreductase chain 1